MKIGIISDTHDHHKNVLSAIEIFNDYGVEYVFHAGDIVSPFTAKAFEKLKKAQFIAVFGNNEGEKLFLTSVINGFGGKIHEYCYKNVINGKSIYMTHTPHNIPEITKIQTYDLVIYGHTHKQDIRQEGKTLVINPGEATDWVTGSAHLVILDLADMSYHVEAL
ncbi:MAG: metallophosphoesterase, partial [Sedimentisphaerales bacterium]|nr:metallophosphoesterase [Sedimentisphaerales bacterium]